MAGENQLWERRIRGELLKLGIEVTKRMHHIQGNPWRTTSQLFACDVFELNYIVLDRNFCGEDYKQG